MRRFAHVALMALGVLAACGGPAETESSETPEAAGWPQRVIVRFDAVVKRADEGADGSSIRLKALAVFDQVEVLEYEKGGPLLVVGMFRKSEVEKVRSLGNPNLGTMFAMSIDDPRRVFSVRTEGTVEIPRPVVRPRTDGLYRAVGNGPSLCVRFFPDGRALSVLTEESAAGVAAWIEEPGRAHASSASVVGAAVRFEMPPVEGKSVEFLGVVTSDGIVRARPVTLPRRLAFHEIRPGSDGD